jgi:hypothetical protein
MKNSVKLGRFLGSGASVNLDTGLSYLPGLSMSLHVPKGHVALLTLCATVTVSNNVTYVGLDVDGLAAGPSIIQQASNTVYMTGSQVYQIPAGRHSLRVFAQASSAAGNLDPTLVTMSWIIAPKGGLAI